MIGKENQNFRNAFYSSLLLLFALNYFLKADYNPSVCVDFGGFSANTDITLVFAKKDKPPPWLYFQSLISNFEQAKTSVQHTLSFHLTGLFGYRQPNDVCTVFIPANLLKPDFKRSFRIKQKFNIFHLSTDDSDPFVI